MHIGTIIKYMSCEADFPDTHPDFVVSEQDIAAIRAQNVELEESVWQEACNVFRADIINKLLEHDALRDGSGWGIFELTDDLNEEFSIATMGDQKSVLLFLFTEKGAPTIDGHKVPTVRVLTNQSYGPNVLAVDFTLDCEGNAQYIVDATTDDPTCSDTLATIFSVNPDDDDHLIFSRNFKVFTPRDVLVAPSEPLSLNDTPNDKGGSENTVCTPFGSLDSIQAKLDALLVARQIVGGILKLKPTHASSEIPAIYHESVG